MYYRSLFPRDLFAQLDRLQREMQQSVDPNAQQPTMGSRSLF